MQGTGIPWDFGGKERARGSEKIGEGAGFICFPIMIFSFSFLFSSYHILPCYSLSLSLSLSLILLHSSIYILSLSFLFLLYNDHHARDETSISWISYAARDGDGGVFLQDLGVEGWVGACLAKVF